MATTTLPHPSRAAAAAPPAAHAARAARPRWGLLAAVWTVPAVASALQTVATLALRGDLRAEWPFALTSLGLWWSWIPLTPLVLAAARRWPLSPRPTAPALARHLGAALAITVAHGALWSLVQLRLQLAMEPAMAARYSTAALLAAGVLARVVTGLLTYGAVAAVGTAIDSLGRLRDQEVHAARLASQLAAAQLGALKMQLHPHFLFNTLHAVTVLIREDPPAAARTVTRLGDLLRLTLARATHTEVTLARELELVRLYLDIERTRFADRLQVTFDVTPEAERARVPDLVLQPLVENAIRHGIAPSAAAGRLVVRAARRGDALVVEVQDDGRGPCADGDDERHEAAETAGTGIGLATTRARLAALHGAAARCELVPAPGGGCLARLVLPYASGDREADDA